MANTRYCSQPIVVLIIFPTPLRDALSLQHLLFFPRAVQPSGKEQKNIEKESYVPLCMPELCNGQGHPAHSQQ